MSAGFRSVLVWLGLASPPAAALEPAPPAYRARRDVLCLRAGAVPGPYASVAPAGYAARRVALTYRAGAPRHTYEVS